MKENLLVLKSFYCILMLHICQVDSHLTCPPPSHGLVFQCWPSGGLSQCSVTCGTGVRHIHQMCHVQYTGIHRHPITCWRVNQQYCTQINCPVNGGWSAYIAGACSVSCAGGTQTLTRTCTNPTPQYGGISCSGSSTMTQTCNTQVCPVDGEWSAFSPLTPCTPTCGTGTGVQIQTRTCNNPPPSNGGATCPGSSTNTVSCTLSGTVCPVDGGLTDWVPGPCSPVCGSGTRTETRTCTNPTPAGAGAPCTGALTQTASCDNGPCPVDGVWGPFGAFGACDQSCGTGTQIQTRTCTPPQNNGADCVGSATQSQPCNTQSCPVHGEWSEFSAPGQCSAVVCGDGTQTQTRTCDNPAPSGQGALPCPGSSVNTVACNAGPCT